MKIVVIILVTAAVLAGVAVSQMVSEKQASRPVSTGKQETPFYCDRLAIKPERRKLHQELSEKLHAAKLGVRELDNGYEFEFPGDAALLPIMTEWIADERACCPFFDITVRLEREGGKIWLGFSGRDGVKQFIHAEFTGWFKG